MQRSPIAVRPATVADRVVVAATLARAFTSDLALTYIFPDLNSRPARLLRFFELMLRSEADSTLTDIAGDGAAAAVWRAPGKWQTTRPTMLRLALPMLAAFGSALPRALRLQARLEAHHPDTPHWYLEFLGCDPLQQGKAMAALRPAPGCTAATESACPRRSRRLPPATCSYTARSALPSRVSSTFPADRISGACGANRTRS